MSDPMPRPIDPLGWTPEGVVFLVSDPRRVLHVTPAHSLYYVF